MASLIVRDDLGFESVNNASVAVRVQSVLIVSVFAGALEVNSDSAVDVAVLVRDDMGAVSAAAVSLSSSNGGAFSEPAGETNSTGYFVTVFHVPSVSEKTVVTINAVVSKSGHVNGQRLLSLAVNPSGASGNISYLVFVAVLALSLVLVSWLIWYLLKRNKLRKT